MNSKVEILVSVFVNGRPIWRKAKDINSDCAYQMTDQEYDRVCAAATLELERRISVARKGKDRPIMNGNKLVRVLDEKVPANPPENG